MEAGTQIRADTAGRVRRTLAWLAWGLAVAAVVTGSEPELLSVVIPTVGAVVLGLLRWKPDGRLPASGLTAVAAGAFGVVSFLIVDYCRFHLIQVKTAVDVKQISMAFLNYSDAHKGAWPAPAIYDSAGRPLLSWRVAVLPFIDADQLYRQFRLNEAWYSPHNLTLLSQMPRTYAAANGAAEAYTTPYQVFVGLGTAVEGPGLRFPLDFTDVHEQTILIVEGRDTVPWTKPADLPYDPHGPLPALGRAPFPGRLLIGARHQQDVAPYVATVNGGTRLLNPGISEATLRAAITRNGGDKLGPDW